METINTALIPHPPDEEKNDNPRFINIEPPKLLRSSSAPEHISHVSITINDDILPIPAKVVKSMSLRVTDNEKKQFQQDTLPPNTGEFNKSDVQSTLSMLKQLGTTGSRNLQRIATRLPSSSSSSPRTPRPRSNSSYLQLLPQEPIATFYCGICLENVAEQDAFMVQSCTELHKFCRECMQSYVEAMVKTQVEVACPGSGCHGKLEVAEIHTLLEGNDEVIAAFDRLQLVKKNVDYRECPGCNHGSTTGSLLLPSLTCEACGLLYCYLHANAHPTKSCQEYARSVIKEERKVLQR